MSNTAKLLRFDRLESPKFGALLKPRLKNINGDRYNCCGREPWISCGSASLSLVTGINPLKLDRYLSEYNSPEDGWFTETILKKLKELNYFAAEITPEMLGAYAEEYGYRTRGPLNENHVLLINAQLDNTDNSMFLLYGEELYHHCHVQPGYHSMYFLNRPIQDMILVHHQDWSNDAP